LGLIADELPYSLDPLFTRRTTPFGLDQIGKKEGVKHYWKSFPLDIVVARFKNPI
jgi:hypothetical protein